MKNENYRMFQQAYNVLFKHRKKVERFDSIDPFNKRLNKSGISPTITTRPEGFKTAILIVI